MYRVPTPPASRADTLAGALPPHVLALAFSSLDDEADLAALRQTCSEFLAPASLAARRLRPGRWPPGARGRFAGVHTLDLSQVQGWQEAWLHELQELHELTALRLGRRTPLTPAGAASLGLLSRLRSLDLSESGLTDGGLRALCRPGLPALTSLSLRGCTALTGAGLEALCALGGVVSLDLSLLSLLTDATLRRLAASLPALASLDLSSCEGVGEPGLRALGSLPALRTLLLPGCWQLGDDALAAVAAAAPHLECFSFCESGEAAGDVGLQSLAALTRLTALDLGYAAWAQTEAGLLRLLPALPALCMLSVAGTEGATDAVLAAAARLSSLTRLDASECQRVTAAGAARLRALPHLADLNLGWNLRLGEAALQAFAGSPAGASLTRVDLSYAGDAVSDASLASLGALPALRSLILHKCCARLSDRGLAALAGAGAPRLAALEISHCMGITAGGLHHLAALPALEALALTDCPRAVTVMGLQALGRCPRLASLDVGDNRRLDDGCMHALSFFPALRQLSLRGCVKVSDHGIAALARLRHLSSLNLELCLSATPAAVDRLRRALPLLRRVQCPAQPGGGGHVGASALWQPAMLYA